MPLKFWDEAFLTATCLINMLPSKVINFATPVEKLLHVKPNYESLRIFGCACWPNLHPYNKRKLSFRSKQCVFLGYSPRHKGVKYLDVKAGRVYISRDVFFDEDAFPFASLNPNVGSIMRQQILLLPSDPITSHVGDAQIDDPMTIPILPVATNPAENVADTSLSDNTTIDDDTTIENDIENDDEMTSNSSAQDHTEQEKSAPRSDAILDHPRANPHPDPASDRSPDPLASSSRGRASSQARTSLCRCARSLSAERPRSASP
jgi:histone deacetylase 1/2